MCIFKRQQLAKNMFDASNDASDWGGLLLLSPHVSVINVISPKDRRHISIIFPPQNRPIKVNHVDGSRKPEGAS